jgi:hypothetical protein
MNTNGAWIEPLRKFAEGSDSSKAFLALDLDGTALLEDKAKVFISGSVEKGVKAIHDLVRKRTLEGDGITRITASACCWDPVRVAYLYAGGALIETQTFDGLFIVFFLAAFLYGRNTTLLFERAISFARWRCGS